MKKYQLQAIKELNNTLHLLEKEYHMDLSAVTELKHLLSRTVNILEKDNDIIFLDPINYSIHFLFEELSLTDYEKMHLFFDLLESPSKILANSSMNYVLFNKIISLPVNINIRFKPELISDILRQHVKSLVENETIEPIAGGCLVEKKDIESLIERAEMTDKKSKEAFKILYDHYYIFKGRPTLEDSLEINRTLEILNIPGMYIMKIMEELKKDLKTRVMKKKDIPKQSMELNMDLRVEGKRAFSNKEWRELNEKAKSYYDIDSNLPIIGLDLKEKIEFIQILRTMEYKEEDIEKILWSIDEAFPQTTITNKSDSAMYNALIIKNFMKKAKEQKSGEISSDVKEIFSNLSTCEENQRKEWLVILEEITKEENDSIKEELLNKREELKKMSFVNKKTWVDVYKENAQCNTHSSVILLQRIFKEVQTCPKEEKELWKQIFIETLERYQIEQYVNYNYELSVSRKLEK